MNFLNVGFLPFVLMIATSYLIPGVAALLTHFKLPSSVTGVIALVLAAISGFLTEAQAPNFDWKHGLLYMLLNLGIALIAHKQLWEGPLANWLHSIWPFINEDTLDVGIDYAENALTDAMHPPTSVVTAPQAQDATPIPQHAAPDDPELPEGSPDNTTTP